MRLLVAAALLCLARVAAACPLCADSNTNAQAASGTSVWWAVGAFLLVPPILGAFVLGLMRRELGARKERESASGAPLAQGLARFRA